MTEIQDIFFLQPIKIYDDIPHNAGKNTATAQRATHQYTYNIHIDISDIYMVTQQLQSVFGIQTNN